MRDLIGSKSDFMAVEIASCGCMNDSRSRSRGRLSKIWPLFKNLPIDFAPAASSRRLHAASARAQNSSRSFSPTQRSCRRTAIFHDASQAPTVSDSPFQSKVKSPPINDFSNPDDVVDDSGRTTPHNVARGFSSLNEYSTNQSVKDHDHRFGGAIFASGSSNHQNVLYYPPDSIKDSVGDIPSMRQIPTKLRTTSPRTWNLYVAVEREFERLGISREKQITSFKHGEFAEVVSEFICKKGTTTKQSNGGNLNLQTKKMTKASSSSEGSPFNPANLSFPNPNDDLCDYIKARFEGSMIVEQNSDCFLGLSDDVIISEPSISEFYSVVDEAGASLRRFCSTLIRAKRKIAAIKSGHSANFPRKIDAVAQILQPLMSDAVFASPHHFKFGLQACINQTIFRQFDTQSYGTRQNANHPNVKLRQFAFLKEYHVVKSLSVEQLMDAASSEFRADFQHFCHKKLRLIQKRMGCVGRWPSKLSEIFLESMKSVWLAHKLAFSFEKPATLFYVGAQAEMDRNYMNPIVVVDDQIHNAEDQQSPFHGIVQFTIFPGFALRDGVLPSTVYLQPRLRAITPSDHHSR